MADPKIGIADLLIANWVPANTSGVTPSIGTGWYDYKNTTPQVTVTDPEEESISTGPTGYFGLAASGAPAQYWLGSVAVNCWATREDSDVNPKQIVNQFKEECKRIIRANYDDVTGFDFIVWRGGFERVETDKKPVVYRYVGETGFGYLE